MAEHVASFVLPQTFANQRQCDSLRLLIEYSNWVVRIEDQHRLQTVLQCAVAFAQEYQLPVVGRQEELLNVNSLQYNTNL